MLLVALAALARAQDRDEPEPPPPPDPARLARGDRDAPAVFLRLREGGVLQLRSGETWKDATLDDCADFLRKSAEEHDAERRKAGESGYELVHGSVKMSRLFVALDVEPAVPWQHVHWLMKIAAEERFRKLELSDGKRRLLVQLPVDRPWIAKEPPLQIRTGIHVIVRRERPGKWGDASVIRPFECRYRFGDSETGDIDAVGAYLVETRKVAAAGNLPLVGELKAGNKVPFAEVLAMMDLHLDKGIEALAFYPVSGPAAEVRRMPRLPFPPRNYD